MRIECNVIEDLIPLYIDEVCSAESRKLVEEHVKTCPKCQKLMESMGGELKFNTQLPEPALEQEPESVKVSPLAEQRALKRSFRKVQFLWLRRTVGILIIIPAILSLILMGIHEYKGNGICYSNLTEVKTGADFLNAVKNGNYEKAADMIDYQSEYDNVLQAYKDLFEEDTMSRTVSQQIKLDNETWVVFENNENAVKSLGTDAYWEKVLRYEYTDVLIPETVWNALVGTAYETAEVYDEVRYYPEKYVKKTVDGEVEEMENSGFYYLKTNYGNFYTASMSGGALHQDGSYEIGSSNMDIYNMYMSYVAIPFSLYTDAQEVLAKEMTKEQQNFTDRYGDIKQLTYEKYVNNKRTQFIKTMKAYANHGGKITNVNYSSVYKSDDYWQIDYKVYTKDGITDINLWILEDKIGTVGDVYDDGTSSLGTAFEGATTYQR